MKRHYSEVLDIPKKEAPKAVERKNPALLVNNKENERDLAKK